MTAFWIALNVVILGAYTVALVRAGHKVRRLAKASVLRRIDPTYVGCNKRHCTCIK